MIATGTDIKPIEIVMFMRSVKSRVLFEQMKGRGVRVIDQTSCRRSRPTPTAKTHFVIVDCVGVTEREMDDTQPLERKKSVSFKALLEHVARAAPTPTCSRRWRAAWRASTSSAARRSDAAHPGGVRAASALAADHAGASSRRSTRTGRSRRRGETFGLAADAEPTADAGRRRRRRGSATEAVAPLATKPGAAAARSWTSSASSSRSSTRSSQDELLEAGVSDEAKEKAQGAGRVVRAVPRGAQGRDRRAPVLLQPAARRAAALQGHQGAGRGDQGPAALVDAREALARLRDGWRRTACAARRAQRLLTDIVSLVRFALHQDDELMPYAEQVRERFDALDGAAGEPGRAVHASSSSAGWR